MNTTHAPVAEPAAIDELEAAWNAPAVEPAERSVAAALVPDAPRRSTLLDDLLVKVLFAMLVIGGLVLLAVTTFD